MISSFRIPEERHCPSYLISRTTKKKQKGRSYVSATRPLSRCSITLKSGVGLSHSERAQTQVGHTKNNKEKSRTFYVRALVGVTAYGLNKNRSDPTSTPSGVSGSGAERWVFATENDRLATAASRNTSSQTLPVLPPPLTRIQNKMSVHKGKHAYNRLDRNLTRTGQDFYLSRRKLPIILDFPGGSGGERQRDLFPDK